MSAQFHALIDPITVHDCLEHSGLEPLDYAPALKEIEFWRSFGLNHLADALLLEESITSRPLRKGRLSKSVTSTLEVLKWHRSLIKSGRVEFEVAEETDAWLGYLKGCPYPHKEFHADSFANVSIYSRPIYEGGQRMLFVIDHESQLPQVLSMAQMVKAQNALFSDLEIRILLRSDHTYAEGEILRRVDEKTPHSAVKLSAEEARARAKELELFDGFVVTVLEPLESYKDTEVVKRAKVSKYYRVVFKTGRDLYREQASSAVELTFDPRSAIE